MLQSLRVKNLAIVDNARVELAPGLNVITGETGAGKSILLGALSLVLGERADRSMIRAEEDACGVEAIFQFEDPSAIDALLDELGLAPCEDGQLIVRRIVSAAGSGKNLINDSPTTVQGLRKLGRLLVDMHGPHDHQSLLDRAFQTDLLDAFGHTWKARGAYETNYRQLLDLKQELDGVEGDGGNVDEQIDFLTYQVSEIEEADLSEGDEEDLQLEHATVANAARILEQASAAQQALTESEQSAFEAIVVAQRAIAPLAPVLKDAEAWQEEAESLAVQVQELSASITSKAASVDGDPERLQWLDERLALIEKLKRKYGGDIPAALAFLDTARTKLKRLIGREAEVRRLRDAIEAQQDDVAAAGGKLSALRATAATKLGKAITRELQDLGFKHGRFEVALTSAEPGPSGMDNVEFGFAPNVGEPMRSLRAIASSGEISRVMLACKAVLADHDQIPVLVFDEIDSNVGGEMGVAIGDKLRAVAACHQVLCITHLPQVAVRGPTHFAVRKSVQDGRTLTRIERLDTDQRTEEIARMLGGRKISSVVLDHARELLANAG